MYSEWTPLPMYLRMNVPQAVSVIARITSLYVGQIIRVISRLAMQDAVKASGKG